MTHEIRNRIVRPTTPDERQRHAEIRNEIAAERPELEAWARAAAVRRQDRVAVGTVFAVAELQVVAAIDDYAAAHQLGGRSEVVREALARLLGIEIARQLRLE